MRISRMGFQTIIQHKFFSGDAVLSSTSPSEDLLHAIPGNSDHPEVRQRLHEDLTMFAPLVTHHRFGDVLEELNEILLRVRDRVASVSHDVEECTRPCRRFNDRLSLVFWRPKAVVPCHLTGSASNRTLSHIQGSDS